MGNKTGIHFYFSKKTFPSLIYMPFGININMEMNYWTILELSFASFNFLQLFKLYFEKQE